MSAEREKNRSYFQKIARLRRVCGRDAAVPANHLTLVLQPRLQVVIPNARAGVSTRALVWLTSKNTCRKNPSVFRENYPSILAIKLHCEGVIMMRILKLRTVRQLLSLALFSLSSLISIPGWAQSGPPKALVHEVTDTYFGQQKGEG
jgi:hypothetical protein